MNPTHDTEETIVQAIMLSLCMSLYVAIWLYGGASWASAIVSAALGTLLLIVLAAPMGAVVFILIKTFSWLLKPRAQP